MPSLESDLEFNIFLKNLGDSLTLENVTSMKYACQPGPSTISPSRLAMIRTGHEFLAELVEDDVGLLNDPRYEPSGHSLEFLRNLLLSARREDLVPSLLEFAGDGRPQSTPAFAASNIAPNSTAQFQREPNDGLSEGLLDDVASKVGRDWKRLARRLGLPDTDVQEIAHSERDSLREAAFQALLALRQRGDLTKEKLKEGLRRCSHNALARQIL